MEPVCSEPFRFGPRVEPLAASGGAYGGPHAPRVPPLGRLPSPQGPPGDAGLLWQTGRSPMSATRATPAEEAAFADVGNTSPRSWATALPTLLKFLEMNWSRMVQLEIEKENQDRLISHLEESRQQDLEHLDRLSVQSPRSPTFGVLRVRVGDEVYDWFDHEQVESIIDRPDVHLILCENISHYFHIPAECLALSDKDGPLGSAADIRRLLRGSRPEMRVEDIRGMSPRSAKEVIDGRRRAAEDLERRVAEGSRRPSMRAPPSEPRDEAPQVPPGGFARRDAPQVRRITEPTAPTAPPALPRAAPPEPDLGKDRWPLPALASPNSSRPTSAGGASEPLQDAYGSVLRVEFRGVTYDWLDLRGAHSDIAADPDVELLREELSLHFDVPIQAIVVCDERGGRLSTAAQYRRVLQGSSRPMLKVYDAREAGARGPRPADAPVEPRRSMPRPARAPEEADVPATQDFGSPDSAAYRSGPSGISGDVGGDVGGDACASSGRPGPAPAEARLRGEGGRGSDVPPLPGGRPSMWSPDPRPPPLAGPATPRGSLDFGESQRGRSPTPRSPALAVFELLDRNRDGYISFSEWDSAMGEESDARGRCGASYPARPEAYLGASAMPLAQPPSTYGSADRACGGFACEAPRAGRLSGDLGGLRGGSSAGDWAPRRSEAALEVPRRGSNAFDVELSKAHSASYFGFEIEPSADQRSLMVQNVEPWGLLAKWNRSVAGRTVAAGDAIVAVDDIVGDAMAMRARLVGADSVRLRVESGPWR